MFLRGLVEHQEEFCPSPTSRHLRSLQYVPPCRTLQSWQPRTFDGEMDRMVMSVSGHQFPFFSFIASMSPASAARSNSEITPSS